MKKIAIALLILVAVLLVLDPSASGIVCLAQTPPSPAELSAYSGLHAAAVRDDAAEIERSIAAGEKTEARDANGRTPLHVAAFGGHYAAARALLRLGADANAFDGQRYDIVTIAAVRNDVEMLKIALAGGGNPRNVTSPYDGTALIAAAHLGHVDIVRTLIAARAPLDHVNNLGWTALIEAVILGDGGRNHAAVVEALVKAGANVNIADRQGATPLALARRRGYAEIGRILEAAGAR
jgi:uncharacterized protein